MNIVDLGLQNTRKPFDNNRYCNNYIRCFFLYICYRCSIRVKGSAKAIYVPEMEICKIINMRLER